MDVLEQINFDKALNDIKHLEAMIRLKQDYINALELHVKNQQEIIDELLYKK